MQSAAIHWHIRDLTGVPDPMALGGIGLARILPVIIFSIIGGTVADNFNHTGFAGTRSRISDF